VAAPEDFASFCAAEHSRLVRALSLYCGSREAAEDATQEALIRASERWGKVAAMGSPAGWVFRVATNQLRSQYRRSRTAARVLANISRETDIGPDIDQLIVVRQAVASLPRRQRQALVLRHTFAMTVEEAAEVMGVSSPAIRSLTHRAVTTLRMQLRPEGADDVAEANDAP
jgi:RNA polymerase sigma factor (sigma-70 family)